MNLYRSVRTVLSVCMLLACSFAFGVLGQDVTSVRTDSARIKAAVAVLPGQSYSVHEMIAPTGTTIKEFVSPAGEVFAVSWQGPYTPDLRQLMGDYFDQYLRAAQTFRRIARHVVHIETGDLVFESGGHMRFIVGRAYLRSKLPDGVTADAIR
ncbi:MAG TPA: DUF2844 domain-containing protein [Terriglobales bacterium]|nr:DUF2844 domain-containing protein [Terriglobales bacterium]